MIRQLKILVVSQFKEFFREPEVIFWVFMFPIILSWVLGIAFGAKGESTRLVGVLEDRNEAKGSLHKLIEQAEKHHALGSSKYFSSKNKHPFKFMFTDQEGALTALKEGKIELFIEMAEDNKIKYHYDPKNNDARLTFLLLEHYLFPESESEHESEPMALVVPGSRYIDFLIPGLLGMEIMNSGMWGIGWALIEFRSKKLLRRMAASPMNRNIFLLSYVVARLLLGIVEFLAIYLFAYFYFGVKIEGSILALVIVFISSTFAFGGMAFLVASRTASTRVGNGIINAISFPLMLISGVFFSYHNFPEWAVGIIRWLPLSMVIDSIRSIFLEAAGIPQILLPSAVLIVLGIIFTFISVRIFNWY